MNKLLLVIDCQFDFIDGSLAVKGAKEKMDNLALYISEHVSEYNAIVFTGDWHPKDHVSFEIWPPHCVAGTQGTLIYHKLLKALYEGDLKPLINNVAFLKKGDKKDKEEYSIMQNEASSEKLLSLIKECEIEQIDVCGIANEYCVNESVKDLAKVKDVKFDINVLFNYVAAISDETVLLKTCDELNINVIKE